MTPDVFTNELAEEITAIFKCFTSKNSAGKIVPLNVFTHDTPIRASGDTEDDEENAAPPEPYVVVKTNAGNIASESEPQTVTAVCVICTYDDNSGRQGARDVLHIIDKIYERFAKYPRLGAACMKYPVDWVLQDEDTYPYYFGGLQMQFEIPAIQKEDPFS